MQKNNFTEEYVVAELKNGIKLIHKPVKSYVSHYGVFVNAGSRDELPEEAGIAHFIEHCIFKGTKKRKAFHILSRLENIGGELNAYTTKEETCIYASFLNNFYKHTVELISDIINNSTFPEKELTKEKDVIIDEINSYKDSPSEQIFDDFEELIFNKHPLASNILGTPENVKKFTKEDVLKFINKHYTSNRIVICSVGNISFSKLLDMTNQYMGDINNNENGYKRIPFEKYKPIIKTVKYNTVQTHCVIGNIIFNSDDNRKTSLILLNNILGGTGLNSRLNLSIREKYGYCYNLESSFNSLSDIGLATIYFGTDSEYLDKVNSLILKELKKLREIKLGSLQLSKAKKQIIGQIAISQESNQNEMLSIGRSFLLYNKVDTIEEVYKKLNNITAENIIDVANEIYDEKNLSVLIYKPKK
ncbi:MAG: zinc protease [Bacteroidetes bacterium GWE2_29_8]|nr:MAG: zinc protease [Bacteroidetes bacterium GWE2_29_8]OFY24292.1 MAG: zinc protease [Bacteroidetes bacterium GWF2_29_10]